MRVTDSAAYNMLAARLQKKYRERDLAVSGLLDQGNAEKAFARAKAQRAKLAAALKPPAEPLQDQYRLIKRSETVFFTIENVIIKCGSGESIPLNLYLPKDTAAPWPVVVVSLGHWPEGKAMAENRILCAQLAALGVAAATYDPICQGERMPYSREAFECRFGQAPLDMQAVSLHMQPGNLAYLLGENLGAQFVADSMRVVDYLCTRPDIDQNRIGAAGQSGGGTQTTWLAALDDRVACYSPIQCLSKQSLTLTASGIGDCEQSILGISQDEGFDYADVLWAAFPKPCRVNAAREDFFLLSGVRQLESELSRLYGLAGAAGDFSVMVAPGGHLPGRETRLSVYDFFCRQFLGRPGPADERELPMPEPEQLACFPRAGYETPPAAVWKPALERARAQRPAGPEELRRQLAQRFRPSSLPYTAERLWQEGEWRQELLCSPDGLFAACRYLGQGSGTLCVVIAGPDEKPDAMRASGADLLRILPWGMHSAFAKRGAGYDEETMLFNAAAVLGKSILRSRFEQAAAAVQRLDEKRNYNRIFFAGQGPGGVLALLCGALLPKAAGTVLLQAQLSLGALFDAEFYQLAETSIEPGLLRLCDLPDLAGLNRAVCAIDPIGPDGGPLPEGAPIPIPAIWTQDSWAAAARWLKEELC